MKIKAGQIIVVASNYSIRRTPMPWLGIQATGEFELDELVQNFIDVNRRTGRQTVDRRPIKHGMDFVSWVLQSGLIQVAVPKAAIWDLNEIGRRIREGRL